MGMCGEKAVGRSFYDGSIICHKTWLCRIGLSRKPNLLETLFREGCTFPKPYSGKIAPSRNCILGRLYLPETLFREGCTLPKPYTGKVAPSRNCTLGRLCDLVSLSDGLAWLKTQDYSGRREFGARCRKDLLLCYYGSPLFGLPHSDALDPVREKAAS